MREPTPDSPFLLLPGPTEVAPEVAAAGAAPMVGHRGPEIRAWLSRDLPRVQRVLNTEASVFPLACSATGAMEAAIRNCPEGRILHLVNGAFSRRWSEVRESCGREGEDLTVEWGRAPDPEELSRALERADYAAVTVVHNETSTGVLGDLPALARVVRDGSDALLCVDTVSSMAATELRLDEWGVDVCFAGVQKAWALPPGLTLCAVSERALERSARATAKGFYFDFVVHRQALDRWQTPSTPALSLLRQLTAQLDRMEAEGLDARYRRHLQLRDRVLAWASGRFEPFADAAHRSPSVTALRAGEGRIGPWLDAVRRRGWVVAPGYGPTRDHLFRLGHMGELEPPTLERALQILDEEWMRLDG